MNREIPPDPLDAPASAEALETPAPHEPRLRPSPRLLIGGVVGLVALGLIVWILATLTPPRVDMIFDLAIAGLVIGLLSAGARYLLRAEALRRSRLVAAELIGVTFGGASLSVLLTTLASEAVGAARAPALVAIQLLAAVLGGCAVFLLAFFVTFGIKAAARVFHSQRPEVEAVFIGVVTGAIGGALTAQAAQLEAWFPFVSATVCAATTYRAVVLHQRYDRD